MKVNSIIEIVGKPKDHVIETMNKVISLIKENKNFKYISHTTEEPKNIKESDKIFSTFTEFELEFNNIDTLTGFCFDFMPSSIEITEPEKIDVKADDLNNTINDIIAKLHQYDLVLKKYVMEQKAKSKSPEN